MPMLPVALAPLAPLAGRLALMGAAAAAGALIAARRGPERVDMATEDALDRLHEGADLRIDRHNGRADAEARLARTVRFGPDGPGLTVEIAGLARFRMRRVPPAR